VIDDLILGYLLTRVFGGRNETRSPSVVFPSSPSTAQPPPGTVQPAPGSTPSSSSPGLPFPSGVTPPNGAQTKPPAGYVKAVEVWQINPQIAAQAGPVLQASQVVGAEPVTVQMLESQFPNGWVGKKSATAEEAATARTLLKQWKDGGVLFQGPSTLADRRAYRMVKHPAGPAPSSSAPSSSSPGPTIPATTTPSMPRQVDPVPPPPAPPAPPPPGDSLVTAVRRGEGLAQVAKRLGQPETMASAIVLQRTNVPGPDGWYKATDLSKGGLAKTGRKGGLQPGDRLFVPSTWSPNPGAL